MCTETECWTTLSANGCRGEERGGTAVPLSLRYPVIFDLLEL